VHKKSCQQLRGLSLLVIGCRTLYYEVAGVIVALKVHALIEDKTDDAKSSFYEKRVP
jgi:hypothetical protein